MTTRRAFLRTVAGAGVAAPAGIGNIHANEARPNILLITADDLNWSTVGAFGGSVPGITPNIDRLAREGIRFDHAHVTSAVCQPSRSVLMTGRYPHRNGAEGFQPIHDSTPTLQEQLQKAGYHKGILSKTPHLVPYEKYHWDYRVDQKDLGMGRAPSMYGDHTRSFLKQASDAGKPFFLMANSDDPHRPYAGSEQEFAKWKKHLPYSRQITVREAILPGCLPDLPDVLTELGQYYTSAHRCDETVGEVLRALDDSGLAGNTLVMFLSDNGMALPFAKTNCYLNSTRTPWIVRWPGRVKPGSIDTEHMISGIDYTPTILDAIGLPQISGVDGSSFLPLVEGKKQSGRDRVFTVFHETSAFRRYEMRCVQTRQGGYIYNAWANGRTVFKNESQSGLTFNAMKRAAKTNPRIAERVELFVHRLPEEYYDFQNDPDGLRNLIDDPAFQPRIQEARREMLAWMKETGDRVAVQYEAYLTTLRQ